MKTLGITTWLAMATLVGAMVACGDDDGGSDPSGPGSGGSGNTGNTGGSGATGGDAGYAFDPTPVNEYLQTDRHGAVEAGTVGIAVAAGLGLNGEDIEIRDQYNASNPEDDAAGMWLTEISNSVTILHMVLDDDLMNAGLTPASVQTSLMQAGPVIVPDTIKYDPSMPTAYPNGRALTDQVVDITIAAALVDLSAHPLSVLADLPLNPPQNDVAFKETFPYLADPH